MSFIADRRVRLSAGGSIMQDAVGVVVGALSLRGADDETIQCLRLAVTEAVGNAVRHAMPRGKPHLEVACAVANCDAIVEVVDYGPGFVFAKRPMPAPLAEAGRGIPLMLTVCDDVRYEPSANGNRLCLRKRMRND